jgi:hypothetical protein
MLSQNQAPNAQPIQPMPVSQGQQNASPSQFQPFPVVPVARGFTNSTGNGYYQSSQGMPGAVSTSGAPVFSNTYASYDYFEGQKERRRPRTGLILAIGAILIVLVGGGLAGLLYYNSQSAPTASSAQTFVIKTPTVKPLFRDSFTNNNTGWLLSNDPGVSLQQVGGGKMTLEDDDNKLLWEILPGKTFSDFRLDVNATLTKGNTNNAYGVYIRGVSTATSDIGTYYRLEIYGDGTFAVFKGTQDSNGNPVIQRVHYSNNPVAAILTEGHSNHITIIAKGSSMVFMVNGVTIYTYTDTTYRSGLIALFVSNLAGLAGGAQATFANLAIFPAT